MMLVRVLTWLLLLGAAVSEWVQLPVIDKNVVGKDVSHHPATEKPSPVAPALPPVVNSEETSSGKTEHFADEGDSDVLTIRRTVGDSFSNKKGVLHPDIESSMGPGEEDAMDGVVEEEEDVDEEDPEEQSAGLPLEDLREAHQALLRQSAAPVSGKLDFLRRLKNRLLRHIASLAPMSARSFSGEEGRGHKGVGFPSHEGTLMSLCFLVFAVFLVKIVMQLIQAMQNNTVTATGAGVRVAQMPDGILPGGVMGTMGTMGTTMMSMMPAAASTRRARRDLPTDQPEHFHFQTDADMERILRIIRKAQFHHQYKG